MVTAGAPLCEGNFYISFILSAKHYLVHCLHCVKLCTTNAPWCTPLSHLWFMVYNGVYRVFLMGRAAFLILHQLIKTAEEFLCPNPPNDSDVYIISWIMQEWVFCSTRSFIFLLLIGTKVWWNITWGKSQTGRNGSQQVYTCAENAGFHDPNFWTGL
jgi:hypothetical protein